VTNLRIPGPTPIPDNVREALGTQMINHRGPEFAALQGRLTEGLRPFFRTEHDILLVTCSGTGVMEAAIVNTLSPGDKVLAVSIGSFGARFGTIAETYGADVTHLDIEWGQGADPDRVREAVHAGDYKAVLVTHNETSTGVTNPIQAIAEAVHAESDALLLVDAVSSMGCIPVEIDKWGLDLVVTGSQKGWEVPPGLAMAAVGPRAWTAFESAKMPRFYLDLGKHRDFAAKGQPPWTPAMSIYNGLDASLKRMNEEGPGAIFERHAAIAAHTRDRVKALGLDLFADPQYASNTITAVKVPEGIDGKVLNAKLREEYDTVLAGGQGKLAGQIFRIGHLGWFEQKDIDDAIDSLRSALIELGFKVPAAALT
jgi:aspartate aminotransferase-like enzyme